MTDRFTNANATNAPKLMNDIAVLRLITKEENIATPTIRMLKTGVLNFGCTYPKTRFGRTASRPITYKMRETVVAEAVAELKQPIAYVAMKKELNRLPPTIFTNSNAAVSEFL